jgi:hypothetical protein
MQHLEADFRQNEQRNLSKHILLGLAMEERF